MDRAGKSELFWNKNQNNTNLSIENSNNYKTESDKMIDFENDESIDISSCMLISKQTSRR